MVGRPRWLPQERENPLWDSRRRQSSRCLQPAHGRRGRSVACGPGVRRRPGPRWLRAGRLAPCAVLDVVDDAEVSSPHPVQQVDGENGLPAEIVREETGVEIRVIDALDQESCAYRREDCAEQHCLEYVAGGGRAPGKDRVEHGRVKHREDYSVGVMKYPAG